MRKLWPWALLAGGGTLGVACNAILGLEPPPSPDAGAATGGMGGTSPAPVCAALDAGLPSNATVEAGVYNPFSPVVSSDAGGNWDFFDLAGVSGVAGTPSYQGGAFDGTYVYFASRNAGLVRYNTGAEFYDAMAWEYFDVSKLSPPNPGGFSGAVYSGRYVYFVPGSFTGSNAITAMVARFDTTGSFKNPESWSSFDVTTIAGADGGGGYWGGVWDSQRSYLYLVPHNDGADDGVLVRYAQPKLGPPLHEDAGAPDSGADAGHVDGGSADGGNPEGGVVDAGAPADAGLGFADPSPWEETDLSTFNAEALGFEGAVYDGTSIYLFPQVNGLYGNAVHSGAGSTVARLHTPSDFTLSSSWTFFDLTNIQGNAYGFAGGVLDGRYVYLVPRAQPIAVRFDTSNANAINNPKAWEWYNLSAFPAPDGGNTPYAGGAFDGRFVYFIPTGTTSGQAIRYDTLSSFGADCAWSTAELTPAAVPARGTAGNYAGAVFDGEYLYYLPSGNSLVARFHARTPKSLPSLASHGSFW